MKIIMLILPTIYNEISFLTANSTSTTTITVGIMYMTRKKRFLISIRRYIVFWNESMPSNEHRMESWQSFSVHWHTPTNRKRAALIK